jgi:hypothetical protein
MIKERGHISYPDVNIPSGPILDPTDRPHPEFSVLVALLFLVLFILFLYEKL